MFKGFSEQTAAFFWELGFHNERPWFREHRDEFERVLHEPFKALAHDCYDELCRRCPDTDFRVHLSRIYRDARRLFGRGPFHDHLWFTITPVGGSGYGPSFWFEIGAADYSYGLGLWAPTAAAMEAFRRAVAAAPAAFERLIAPLGSMKGFSLHGESFRRPKGDLGEILNPWYNRKYLDFGAERDHDALLFSSELPRRVAADWARLMPMCRFMVGAVQGVTPPKAEKR